MIAREPAPFISVQTGTKPHGYTPPVSPRCQTFPQQHTRPRRDQVVFFHSGEASSGLQHPDYPRVVLKTQHMDHGFSLAMKISTEHYYHGYPETRRNDPDALIRPLLSAVVPNPINCSHTALSGFPTTAGPLQLDHPFEFKELPSSLDFNTKYSCPSDRLCPTALDCLTVSQISDNAAGLGCILRSSPHRPSLPAVAIFPSRGRSGQHQGHRRVRS